MCIHFSSQSRDLSPTQQPDSNAVGRSKQGLIMMEQGAIDVLLLTADFQVLHVLTVMETAEPLSCKLPAGMNVGAWQQL